MSRQQVGRQQVNMTTGSVLRHIVRFAFPYMLGMLFQNLYNLADISIAGHMMGDEAIAAIASTSSFFYIMQNVSMGFSMGSAILVSQAFGADQQKETRRAFATMLMLVIALSVVFTAGLLLFINPLLRITSVPAELMTEAKGYILIVIAGFIIMMLYNMFAALLRSVGDSKTPLYFLIISCAGNIVLDVLFIGVLRIGVKGAGYATVMAQMVSVILCARYVASHYPYLKLSREDFAVDLQLMKRMLTMGLSVAFANSLYAIGDMALQGAVNKLGTSCITARAVGTKLVSICCMPSVGLANACATFSAQNSGAGRFDRIGAGIRCAILCTLATNIITTAVMYPLGAPISQLLTGTADPLTIANSALLIKINVPFIFMQNCVMSFRMSIQGMGYKMMPTVATGIELLLRCFSAFVLVVYFGFAGICWGQPLSWVLSGLFMAACYKPLLRKAQERYAKAHDCLTV